MQGLSQIVEAGEAERLATGFVFTEGRFCTPTVLIISSMCGASKFYRLRPGIRGIAAENTGEGNGTTFDSQGRLCSAARRQPAPDALAGRTDGSPHRKC